MSETQSYVDAADFPADGPTPPPGMPKFAFVLLAHKNWWRTKYYFNQRHKNKKLYGGRIGLFGGRENVNEGGWSIENLEQVAQREVREETGIEIGQDGPIVLQMTGFNIERDESEGAVFFYKLDRDYENGIRTHLRDANKKQREADQEEIGELHVVTRYLNFASFVPKWRKFTPIAIYALFDVLDRRLDR